MSAAWTPAEVTTAVPSYSGYDTLTPIILISNYFWANSSVDTDHASKSGLPIFLSIAVVLSRCASLFQQSSHSFVYPSILQPAHPFFNIM